MNGIRNPPTPRDGVFRWAEATFMTEKVCQQILLQYLNYMAQGIGTYSGIHRVLVLGVSYAYDPDLVPALTSR